MSERPVCGYMNKECKQLADTNGWACKLVGEVNSLKDQRYLLGEENKKLNEEIEKLKETCNILSDDEQREALRKSLKDGKTYTSEEVRKRLGISEEDAEKEKCKKCGCGDFDIRETYGPSCLTQRWVVCESCGAILRKIEEEAR